MTNNTNTKKQNTKNNEVLLFFFFQQKKNPVEKHLFKSCDGNFRPGISELIHAACCNMHLPDSQIIHESSSRYFIEKNGIANPDFFVRRHPCAERMALHPTCTTVRYELWYDVMFASTPRRCIRRQRIC